MFFSIIKSHTKATNEQLLNWLEKNFAKIVEEDSKKIATLAYKK
jgi:hypothetical protein